MKVRTEIAEAFKFETLDKTPTGKAFERLVTLAWELLPGDIEPDTVADSIRHLAGSFCTKALLEQTAWRLAGNYKRLACRKSVPPWHTQMIPEWVPGQVVSCKLMQSEAGTAGALIGFRLLAGTPAGLKCFKWWGLKQCRLYAREFGWPRWRGGNPPATPFSDPHQLVNQRAYLLISPDESGKEPGFKFFTVTPQMKKWNTEVIKARFRVGGYTCPVGNPSWLPCQKCPVGYDKCRAATHRKAWAERDCPDCGETAYFDEDVSKTLCVDCYAKSIFQKRK